MARGLAVCLFLLASTGVSAQSTVAAGDIRCPDCSITGQKPDPPGFDATEIQFVPKVIPAFHEGQTIHLNVIARVLHAAPLVVEDLDSAFEMVDRNMKVVRTDDGSDDGTCGPTRVEAVELASRPVVAALRVNDIITGTMLWNRDEEMPDAILAAKPVLTNVRKVSAPVRYFHAAPTPVSCRNRSGRVIVYWGPEDGEITEVYNDGGVYHRNAAYLSFTRERLSTPELTDLLAAFPGVNFDALPSTFPGGMTNRRSTLSLIGARYQPVKTEGLESLLAPILARLDALAARASSHSQYILKHETPIPLTVLPWPYPAMRLDRLVDPRRRSSDNPPDASSERVPDAFLARLPAAEASDDADRDPSRTLHFSQDGKLYRVGRPFHCQPGGPCTFRGLDFGEVAPPASGDCVLGTPNCETIIYPGGRQVHRAIDPYITAASGRLWPPDLGVRLRDVAAAGTVISKDEYDRHKTLYFPILRFRTRGANYIEDGVLYPHVRLCQIEPGSADECELDPFLTQSRVR